MTAIVTRRDHGAFVPRARRWAKKNLYSTRLNGLLSLLVLAVLGYLVYTAARWIFGSAEWDVVVENRRLLTIGRMPEDDEWRIWPPLYLALGVAGGAYGTWSQVSIRDGLWLGGGALFVFGFLAQGQNGLLLGGAAGTAVVAYVLAHHVLSGEIGRRWRLRVVIAGAVAILPVLVFFVSAVNTNLLGGLLLNVYLAAFAITLSLPLGILLALGRQSRYTTVKYACVGFIELFRAGPLVLWLLFARLVLPDLLPSTFDLDTTDLIIRAIIILTFFTSAYIAEIVRGGLQAVPGGQIEAAKAIGLGTFNITVFIVLPQALRAVIPALVSQVISLWKDTSLVTIIGLIDQLRAAQATQSQAQFVGTHMEVLLYVGLVFWAGAFTMSRLSQRIERNLGL